MSTQRKLVYVLLSAAALLGFLVLALHSGAGTPGADPEREKDAPPRPQQPSEPTESSDTRSALATLPVADSTRVSKSQHVPGPPIRIFGRIGDEHGARLEAVNVLVYDSRGEKHQPQVLRPDWYECTLNERGRTLVVAKREGHCDAEVPFELMEADVERNIELVLPAQANLRIHVRDLEGKPLPRFPKGQPLRSRLRAVASIEDLPAQLPVQFAANLFDGKGGGRAAWGDFEPFSPLQGLSGRVASDAPRPRSGPPRPRDRRRNALPAKLAMDFEYDPASLDDERFDQGVGAIRAQYKKHFDTDGQVAEDDSRRQFLAALGYVGEDGTPIEGESPVRDLVGMLTLERPLPLRVSLLAGQTRLEALDPVPWTEDLHFKVDFARLSASYVHAWLFAQDAQTGARLPNVRVHLHVESLTGGIDEAADPQQLRYSIVPGKEAPPETGAPRGWRFPEGDLHTDLDGRADFQAALPGWWRLTLEAKGYVPLSKWVCVDGGPECYLDYFALAPLATSRLHVTDPDGTGVRAKFEVRPLLHAKQSEGLFETWDFESDFSGELELKNVGRQLLLLRSADPDWALDPLLIDNGREFVDKSTFAVVPSRHVLIHLPASLPWTSTVNVSKGLTRPVYEDTFGGKTLVDLWLPDGAYTLRVAEGVTALMTIKFTLEGEPQLLELVR